MPPALRSARGPRSPRYRLFASVALLALVSACTSTIDGQGALGSAAAPAASSPTAHSASPSASSSAPGQSKADFGSCSGLYRTSAVTLPADRRGKLQFSCASIRVPLDYAQPSGRTISLELVRIHDTDNISPAGSLLTNPGGPGVSGNVFALQVSAELPLKLLRTYDLIGFDPRGVGASTPIRCLTNSERDTVNAASPDVLTTDGFAAARATARMIANACEAKYGSALPYFNTVNTAKDMDQVRQAVGDPTMNYLGFSYGTELGSTYAHLFPKTVRVMVLDGAVNPLTSDVTAFADQLQGFENAFDQFASYCRQHSPCRSIGDPRKAVYAIQAAAMTQPLPATSSGDPRLVTFAVVSTGVLQALYSESLWPSLATALAAGRNGDGSGLLALADQYNQRYQGQYTNVADANNAISCNDSKVGLTDSSIRATARSWAKRFPIFGLWSAASLFSCQQWQDKRTVPPRPTAATPNKVLVVGNTHDPATPYRGAVDLTRTMGNAELLSWNGEGHTSFLQGSSCIDSYVQNYLVSDTLPPAGKTCPR